MRFEQAMEHMHALFSIHCLVRELTATCIRLAKRQWQGSLIAIQLATKSSWLYFILSVLSDC